MLRPGQSLACEPRVPNLSPLLMPFSLITTAVTALRMRRTGWYCPVPVICVGNATMGGAGKTTVVLDLARWLVARHWDVHVLLRGYGGSARGLHWVEPDDPASLVSGYELAAMGFLRYFETHGQLPPRTG